MKQLNMVLENEIIQPPKNLCISEIIFVKNGMEGNDFIQVQVFAL